MSVGVTDKGFCHSESFVGTPADTSGKEVPTPRIQCDLCRYPLLTLSVPPTDISGKGGGYRHLRILEKVSVGGTDSNVRRDTDTKDSLSDRSYSFGHWKTCRQEKGTDSNDSWVQGGLSETNDKQKLRL